MAQRGHGRRLRAILASERSGFGTIPASRDPGFGAILASARSWLRRDPDSHDPSFARSSFGAIRLRHDPSFPRSGFGGIRLRTIPASRDPASVGSGFARSRLRAILASHDPASCDPGFGAIPASRDPASHDPGFGAIRLRRNWARGFPEGRARGVIAGSGPRNEPDPKPAGKPGPEARLFAWRPRQPRSPPAGEGSVTAR